jgi:TolB-like protein
MFPDRDVLERQLTAIFASSEFASAPKMRALLRYIVDATVAGDAERLKGYSIGVDVFERGADFDPATDPIVRVQAGRLRKLLDTYYRTDGLDDPLRIAIPKGGYTAQISANAADCEGREDADAPPEADESVPDEDAVPSALARFPRPLLGGVAAAIVAISGLAFWLAGDGGLRNDAVPPPVRDSISVAVLPFANMANDPSKIAFADGLTDALTTALSRVKSVSLASRTSAFQYRDAHDLRRVGRELGVRYIVEGGLQHDGSRMRVNVQLIDAGSGAHIWAHSYDRDVRDELAVQSELVTTLAAELRPQLFNAAKRELGADPAGQTTAWQLFIQSTWIPGEARNSLAWEKERVGLARRALEINPDLGQAHSVLADKLAYLATVDPPSDTPEARAEATAHANRAMELAAGDPEVVFNVSIHHWHAGRMAASAEALQRTLDLDPNHVLARFLVKVVPFTCKLAPQSLIEEMAAFDANISPDNPIRWVTLSWISKLYLSNGDFERAAEAARRSAQIFSTPNTLYQLAAILVRQGDSQSALEELARQRANWPNIDLRHYADAVVPRRCGSGKEVQPILDLYRALADAAETSPQVHVGE